MMRISVLVPAFNEAQGIGGTLRAIRAAMAAFDARGWATELIVCDNNSTDATAELARAAGATVVFEPVNQIARARNCAAAAATGDWLVFVDADSLPSAALFADVAAQIEGGRVMAGGSTVTMDDTRFWARAMVASWNWTSRLTRWAAGSFIYVRADAFRAVGGFNQALYASEEIDLFRRLKKAARRAGLGIRILHRHPLHTSARKLRLYTWREMAVFMMRTALSGGRTLKRPDECFVWYDGRR
jgi:glycosyltransferase involved in cell wall biosynthesis